MILSFLLQYLLVFFPDQEDGLYNVSHSITVKLQKHNREPSEASAWEISQKGSIL